MAARSSIFADAEKGTGSAERRIRHGALLHPSKEELAKPCVVAGLILVILNSGIGIGVDWPRLARRIRSELSAISVPVLDTSHLFATDPSAGSGGTYKVGQWERGCHRLQRWRLHRYGVPTGARTSGATSTPTTATPSFQAASPALRPRAQFSHAPATGNTYVGHCQCVGHTGAFDGKAPGQLGATCGAWNKRMRSGPGRIRITSANPPDCERGRAGTPALNPCAAWRWRTACDRTPTEARATAHGAERPIVPRFAAGAMTRGAGSIPPTVTW